MKRIDEKIKWLEQNATRKDDDLVRLKLKMIKDLYSEIENAEDKLFMDEIIETFLSIMDIQRGVIVDLLMEMESGSSYTPGQHSFVVAYTQPDEGFQNDKQLQTAFATYLSSKGKSSYTVNDYCSRIRNLWKSFYSDFKAGDLPEELLVDEQSIFSDQPLLNAFNHAEELNAYISMKMASAENKRNLANTQAALRRFDDFKCSLI